MKKIWASPQIPARFPDISSSTSSSHGSFFDQAGRAVLRAATAMQMTPEKVLLGWSLWWMETGESSSFLFFFQWSLCGAFHGHGGTPIAPWMVYKKPYENGWWLGGWAPFFELETSRNFNHDLVIFHVFPTENGCKSWPNAGLFAAARKGPWIYRCRISNS